MGPELHLEHDPIDVLVLHVTHFDHQLVLLPPVEARLYRVSAIPLLWGGGWAARSVLVLFVVLIASLFGRTMHRICWGIIKLALLAGLIGYVYLVFKLA